ncbi:MAG: translational initiation factor [Acidobacteria bacterium]|nr:translational initiation factor [Acidobacteriota bacterium]
MLFFVNSRVDPKGMSPEELWDLWDREADAALPAKAAGKLLAAYKVSGQRRVIAILNVDSHDELDQILMSALPMAHHLEFEEVLPVREYEKFAADVKRRWKPGA